MRTLPSYTFRLAAWAVCACLQATILIRGGAQAAIPYAVTPDGDPWNYCDGYVLSAEPALPPDLTWYWGYSDARQVPGDGFIYFHTSGRTDAYPLNGIVVPNPPYYGTYEGPTQGGPLAPVISAFPAQSSPNVPLAIVSQPDSVSGPPGGSVTLSVGVAGSQPIHYQWLYLGVFPVGFDSSELQIDDLNFHNLGSYYVDVWNCWGFDPATGAPFRIRSFPALVSMATTNYPPNISQQPVDAIAFEGQTASFDVGLYGDEPLAISWTHDKAVIPGAHQSSLVLSNLSLSQAGSYQLFATNAYGFTNSRPATLVVRTNARPEVAFVNPPTNSSLLVPTNLLIEVMASDPDDTVLGVELFLQGQRLAALNQAPYQFNYLASTAGTRTFTAVATDSYGARTSISMSINFVLPSAKLAIQPDGSITLSLAVPAGVASVLVEASADLNDWAIVSEIIPSGASVTVNDSVPPDVSPRFYRITYSLP